MATIKATMINDSTVRVRTNCKERIEALKGATGLFTFERESKMYTYFLFKGTVGEAYEFISSTYLYWTLVEKHKSKIQKEIEKEIRRQ